MMGPTRTITLFAPPPRTGGGESSWMVSLALHAAACGWLFYGLARVPQLKSRTVHQRLTLRILNVPIMQPELREYAANGSPVQSASSSTPILTAPASLVTAKTPPSRPAVGVAAAPAAAPAQENAAPALPAAVQLAQTAHQQQTLIQPDAPKDMVLQRATPVPLVMMWAQQPPPQPAVAAPPPKPAMADMRASIARPNRETAPAPLNLSATNFHNAIPMMAGTTSPVVVRGPDPKQMPTVAAASTTPPAPVRIISLSDRQQQEGPVAVPLANASARPSTSQSLTAGKAENSSGTGRGTAGNQTSVASGTPGAGNAGKQPAAQGAQGQGTARPAGNSSSAQANASNAARPLEQNAANAAQSSGPGIGSENAASVKRITLPKDGKFGVVVVGTSIADEYPEAAAIWAGRLVYTVYLHVGMGKSWILQYSLPAGTEAAAAGVRPDAPWPYDIVVPRLDGADYDSDALMVHGFVNGTGRFERLNVVLPSEFAQTKFVVNALNQWQFRAAQQNGQPTPVEILLIIPEQDE